MSFRDIGAILKKNEVSDGGNVICNGDNNNNKSSKEEATRLWNFSQGKKLVEVSIDLGLREKEASKLFSEF